MQYYFTTNKENRIILAIQAFHPLPNKTLSKLSERRKNDFDIVNLITREEFISVTLRAFDTAAELLKCTVYHVEKEIFYRNGTIDNI
jgi:hypothetical protein